MNAVNIDTLLKVAAPAAKTAPANSPREGEQFGSYLRDAAEANGVNSEKPAAKAPMAKEEPAEEPITTATGQEQGSTATSDQETTPTEYVDTTNEDETSEAITDEVILSVTATALVEVVVEASLVLEPPEVALPVVDAIAPKGGVPEETQPESKQFPNPLDIVDATENTTTGGEGKNGNDEKLIPIESNLVDVKSVELSKNSGLTPSAEVPKPTAVTKPILPDKSTESGNGEEASDNADAVNVDAAIVEAIAKMVDSQAVTTDAHANETKAESPAPPTAIGGSQNQQPLQPQASPTEAPVQTSDNESHMPTIDRARFVQRVANAFRSAQQNDGQIQMRLSPPELGSLKIEIAVRNGVLSANLEAETADARRLLLDNLPALRQRLAEQDIRIDKFEVDIRRDGGQQQGQAEAQQQQADQQSQNAAARNRIRTTRQHEVITAPSLLGKPAVAPGGLDVRV